MQSSVTGYATEEPTGIDTDWLNTDAKSVDDRLNFFLRPPPLAQRPFVLPLRSVPGFHDPLPMIKSRMK